MELQKRKINVLKVILSTGLTFVIGGFFRTFLMLTLPVGEREQSVVFIFLAIWAGFIVEAMVGVGVLAQRLRDVYPFKKLWFAGVGAFAVGSLFPALFINQFFIPLLVVPGILIGAFFALFLGKSSGRMKLFSSITLGFLICQVLFFVTRGFDNELGWWLSENVNPHSATILLDATMDMIIGISAAVGVILVLRERDKEVVK